jgi:hypothetical protein
MNTVTILGYIASLFVAISLMVKNNLKFRLFNLTGCITFIIYGFIIDASPVIFANSILLVINIYQIFKLFQFKEQFSSININSDDKVVNHFLQQHFSDINKFFPKFQSLQQSKKNLNLIVFRNEAMANIFVADVDENGNAFVDIDYTIPKFRDFKLGKFLFETNKNQLIQEGVKKVVYETVDNNNHLQFLQIMGFTVDRVNEKKCWVKKLV